MPYKDTQKRLEYGRNYSKTHKEDPELRWKRHLKTYYNMSADEYYDLLDKQDGCCAICGREEAARRFHVDHDHECCSGKKSCGMCIRGLLCGNCNMALGLLQEDPNLMINAIRYLAVNR